MAKLNKYVYATFHIDKSIVVNPFDTIATLTTHKHSTSFSEYRYFTDAFIPEREVGLGIHTTYVSLYHTEFHGPRKFKPNTEMWNLQ